MKSVQGPWNLSNLKQHSLKVFHNVLMYSRHGIVFRFFFFFLWTDLTPPFSLLPLLSHPLSPHIHISFTHLSLLPQLCSFSHFISTLFSFLLSASFKVLSIFSFSPLYLPLAYLFIFHAFSIHSFFITVSQVLQCFLHTFFFYRCLSRWRCLQ